jgi:2-furoyl-CoA dehydrogenase large subunit
LPFRKVAGRAHWDPAGLPSGTGAYITETASVSPGILGSPDENDRIASAATFGFVIDLAAIEIDSKTGSIRIDKYASVHDVGTQLNPRIVEGQVHGGFAHGLGAALLEELVYDERGNFQSGTFADYLCPTAVEVPLVAIGHVETPSPMNALGAKGMGDGSSMLTPAAMANAVADALGRDDVVLPLTLRRVWSLANGRDPQAKRATAVADQPSGRCDGGEVVLCMVAGVCALSIAGLAAIVPGYPSQPGWSIATRRVVIGVADIPRSYDARIELRRKADPFVSWASIGALDPVQAWVVTLTPEQDGRTRLHYRYAADVGGKVVTASVPVP